MNGQTAEYQYNNNNNLFIYNAQIYKKSFYAQHRLKKHFVKRE